jgi:hypothetical protein
MHKVFRVGIPEGWSLLGKILRKLKHNTDVKFNGMV